MDPELLPGSGTRKIQSWIQNTVYIPVDFCSLGDDAPLCPLELSALLLLLGCGHLPELLHLRLLLPLILGQLLGILVLLLQDELQDGLLDIPKHDLCTLHSQ